MTSAIKGELLFNWFKENKRSQFLWLKIFFEFSVYISVKESEHVFQEETSYNLGLYNLKLNRMNGGIGCRCPVGHRYSCLTQEESQMLIACVVCYGCVLWWETTSTVERRLWFPCLFIVFVFQNHVYQGPSWNTDALWG